MDQAEQRLGQRCRKALNEVLERRASMRSNLRRSVSDQPPTVTALCRDSSKLKNLPPADQIWRRVSLDTPFTLREPLTVSFETRGTTPWESL